uniref:alpha/beta hydrolase family protein n=1 Tax=Candidatus Planktophila sp. TaxID=2175601 RepID=UPI0040491787
MNKSRLAVFATAASLLAAMLVSVPTAAQAATVCEYEVNATSGDLYNHCVGKTADGSNVELREPLDYNGTVFVWSHGYRYNTNLPAGIQPPGGTTPYIVDMSAQAGPTVAVMEKLMSMGYAVAGSSYPEQGWGTEKAIKANVQLISWVKNTATEKTNSVIAWGASYGGFVTQALAEKYPKLIKAAAPVCTAAGRVDAELTMLQDVLWGLKTFFDPTITVSGYAPGALGVGQAALNLGKVAAVLRHIGGTITQTDNAKTWPATSTMPAAVKAIPARSALVLVGLMAGVPTQSQNFDATSFPGAEFAFALALAPALALAENAGYAAGLGIIATHDLELRAGGTFYDNTKTDYAARVADERASYNVALSGNTAIDAMLGVLSSPLAPRITANAASLAKFQANIKHNGVAKVPTITLTGTADMITPAGNSQWLADRNAKNTKKFLPLWVTTPEKWTKFTAVGLPDTTRTDFPNGTGHCQFTTEQFMLVANLAIASAKTGSVPSNAAATKAVDKVEGVVFDREFSAPLLKYYQK